MKAQTAAPPPSQAEITKHLSQPVNWGPLSAVIVTVLIYFVSQYGAIFLLLIYPIMQHWNMEQASNWLQNSTGAQFATMALVEIFSILLLWLFLRRRHTNFKAVGWNRRPKWKDLAYALSVFGLYFISLNFIIFPIVKNLTHINFEQKQDIGFQSAHGPMLALVFVALAILPPLVEETMVRGFLYTGLRKGLPKYAAVIITSALFAMAHLQLGSGQPALWSAAIDTFTLSLFLIYLREQTNSLYASVGVHFIKNSLAFLALFVWHVV